MARATPLLGYEGPGSQLLVLGDVKMVHSGSDARFLLLGGRFVSGDTLLRLLVIVVLVGLINAVLMACSRIFYALSRAIGFEKGTRVNQGGTPTVGLLVSTLAAAAFLIGGTYSHIIAITAFLFVANYTFTFLSLFALRVREPNTPRPFRAWGHPWTTGFVLFVSLGLLAGALAADTRNSLISIALLLLSYPIFRVINRGSNA
jgi:APA family basic amino acid/polyamine antiporter